MSNQNIMQKVATPYAEALLELAQENKLLPKTTEDLSIISNILSSSIDLQSSLSNPLINVLTKKSILENLFNDQVNSFVLNFLLVLVDRRRIFLLNAIIDKYLELAYKIQSTVLVDVSTAISFTEIQQQEIIKKVRSMTNSNNVKLTIHVEPDLIAGFIIQVGSKVVDTSLSGKLKQVSVYLNQL